MVIKEIEGEGKGTKRGGRGICTQGTKRLLLDRGETYMAHRQRPVYTGKGEGGHSVRVRCLILIGHANKVSRRGLLTAGFQKLDSWTLVVSLGRRK